MDTSHISDLDPFATLGVDCRPWLSPDLIHNAFRERARQLHPDAPNGNAEQFAQLTSARDLILNPASRLAHLAALQSKLPANSGSWNSPLAADLGFEIGSIIQKAEQLLTESEGKSGLNRALTIHAIKSCDLQLESLETRLTQVFHDLETDTLAVDAAWPETGNPPELLALSNRWKYAQRWHDQVRKARFKIKTWLPVRIPPTSKRTNHDTPKQDA